MVVWRGSSTAAAASAPTPVGHVRRKVRVLQRMLLKGVVLWRGRVLVSSRRRMMRMWMVVVMVRNGRVLPGVLELHVRATREERPLIELSHCVGV